MSEQNTRWSAAYDDADLAALYAYPDEPRWLRANMVASVDGAAWWDDRTGQLGNAADHELFQLLRALSDVVIVGAETVRTEGYGPVRPGAGWPALRNGRPAVPPLAVVSRRLDLDLDSPAFTEAAERTIVLTSEAAPADRLRAVARRAEVIVTGESRVDFNAAVDELAARGHRRLLCEGGPRVLGQVTAAGLLDDLCLTISPVLLAGDPARVLNDLPIPDGQWLRLAHVLRSGDHLLLRYTARRESAG